MAPISVECCYSNIVYSKGPVYIVIMHSEVWILLHTQKQYTHQTHYRWCFMSTEPVPTWMPYHVLPCFRVLIYIP